MIRFTLRIPGELHSMLCKQAAQQERSLNSHILYILKTSLSHEPSSGRELPGELVSLDTTENQESDSP